MRKLLSQCFLSKHEDLSLDSQNCSKARHEDTHIYTPSSGERADRRVPKACWLVSLCKIARYRLSERHCLKKKKSQNMWRGIKEDTDTNPWLPQNPAHTNTHYTHTHMYPPYTHTHHTCTHVPHTYTYHTHMHIHAHLSTLTHTHHMLIFEHTYTTHTYTCTYSCTYIHMHTHTHCHTHAHTGKHGQTQANTHIHTCMHVLRLKTHLCGSRAFTPSFNPVSPSVFLSDQHRVQLRKVEEIPCTVPVQGSVGAPTSLVSFAQAS